MSLESEPAQPPHRGRLLNDPVVIRALAHPLRLDLLAALGRRGQATTAEVARELGLVHGVASHHLRLLAKYGFIEQIPGKDKRERPWRPVEDGYQWPDAQPTPEATAATEVLEQVIAERVIEGFTRWRRSRHTWPGEWLDGSGVATATVYLTADELSAITAEFEAMVRRHTDARPIGDAASRPDGSVPVDLAYFAVPTPAPAAAPARASSSESESESGAEPESASGSEA
ncbi:helix-turn-helix domain-containing protein [Catenulispora sp. NF23]|uniref:helix-turn-helix domain-containing protein n=1 Tax=Catenulispora pinistramenti TaxID=2705254 RepID=UPI001BADE3FB|nr:helix-turn-helix domain-containing protein [Catenulispora pinistramenti]MBS2537026.1 helix-turn-helix domain-containing protein [Catenulispora pinistramenti]